MNTHEFVAETQAAIKRCRNSGQCEKLFERACNEVCAPHGMYLRCENCPIDGCFRRVMKIKFNKEVKD